MYVCGVTPYDVGHLGHAAVYTTFDTLRGYLEFSSYEVEHIQNITDIDDDMVRKSKELGVSIAELTDQNHEIFLAEMDALSVLRPAAYPRVSGTMTEIIEMVKELIDRDLAYEVDGYVFFEASKAPHFGALSGLSHQELRDAPRTDMMPKEPDELKRDPLDFLIWQPCSDEGATFDSPWCPGRPGWHIECSAMARASLGDRIDIHGGGRDLIYPHHESEIVQSEGATGARPYVGWWMHHGLAELDGEKMSKSLGNFFTVGQVLEYYDPEGVRFFLLKHHLRSPIGLEVIEVDGQPSFPDLDEAERRLDYFYSTLKRIDEFLAVGKDPGDGDILDDAKTLIPQVRDALADDFNTPVAVASLGDAAKAANKLLDEGKGIPKDVRRRSLRQLGRDIRDIAGNALGILTREPAEFLDARRNRLAAKRGLDIAAVEAMLVERAEARKQKDFAKSDELRDRLTELKVEVLDTPRGAEWRVAE